MRIKTTIVLVVGLLFSVSSTKARTNPLKPSALSAYRNLYTTLELEKNGLSSTAFELGLKGWQKMVESGMIAKTNLLTICDFSQSANNKRMYVIDMASGKLLFQSLVAHGRNTGDEFAKYFSNKPSSYQSSLGFYATKQTYNGEHGLSLKLFGLEKGFNDKADERAIVIHGADYVCESFINKNGRLGRSLGCPSIPFEIHKQVIETIKGGSCLFIYYPDKNYIQKSKVLN